ncbi:hypothetical protein [Luteimonas sp. 100069]|uniref:hypothetical protein n=1 Tax=Luteimonas sp. 100069 TaxID=2006109 RepID=UPI000F506E24|nr:hypothetical protein [Luteimonas sp. 100069]RPD85374.1 hypothetical protein EGK76_10770 [Luteimonas sp. 100069]
MDRRGKAAVHRRLHGGGRGRLARPYVPDDNGEQITLDINLDVGERPGDFVGGVRDVLDTSENWSIEVVKIDAGGFSQSYVVPGQNTGRFDSEDVNPVSKGASDPQVGAAHEFGHMIGLPDEYNGKGGPEGAERHRQHHAHRHGRA